MLPSAIATSASLSYWSSCSGVSLFFAIFPPFYGPILTLYLDQYFWRAGQDGSTRTVVPRVREAITDALESNDATLEESESVYHGKKLISLQNQVLYRCTLATVLETPLPTALGNLGTAENRTPSDLSCVSCFEHLRDGRLIEILEEYMAEYFIGF